MVMFALKLLKSWSLYFWRTWYQG